MLMNQSINSCYILHRAHDIMKYIDGCRPVFPVSVASCHVLK